MHQRRLKEAEMKFAAAVAKVTLSTKDMNYLEEQAALEELISRLGEASVT
jgi:hypothetical protein